MASAIKALIALILALNLSSSHQVETDREILKIAFHETLKENENVTCTVEGTIPPWINGYFLRQTCGSFGNGSNSNDKISHMSDCMGMVASFEIQNGRVRFSNRYYDTHAYNVWKHYNYKMGESKIAWPTVFTPFNVTQMKKWALSFGNKYQYQPIGSFWRMENEILAVTEVKDAMSLNLGTLESNGAYHWQDGDNVGLPPETNIVGHVMHTRKDADGTMWGMATTLDIDPVHLRGNTSYAVYKILPNTRQRQLVGRHYLGPEGGEIIAIPQCRRGINYPDDSVLPGYVHSFSFTENYIVIPSSSWLLDPCRLILRTDMTDPQPFMKANYRWSLSEKSRLLIMRKDTGQFVGNIEVVQSFFTHQINAFERDDLLVLDVLTYNDSKLYDTNTFIDKVLDMTKYYVALERFTINTTSWRLTSRHQITPEPLQNAEYPNINPLYSTKDYNYTYILTGALLPGQTSITKLNVNNMATTRWLPSSRSMLPWEPVFIPSTERTSEDDGVLLVGGIDTLSRRGIVTILNATTMIQIGHVTAPSLTPIGQHSKFFQWEFPEEVIPTVRSDSSSNTMSLSVFIVLCGYVYFSFCSGCYLT